MMNKRFSAVFNGGYLRQYAAIGLLFLSSCVERSVDVAQVAPSNYVYQHADGWVEVWRLSTDLTYIHAKYESMFAYDNGGEPKFTHSGRWSIVPPSMSLKSHIRFEEPMMFLDFASLQTRSEPTLGSSVDAYWSPQNGEHPARLLFQDESGYQASKM